MAKRLSDMDKNLKVRHLGGKPVTLTVAHVGLKSEKKKSDIQFIAGGEGPDEYEETAWLFWKEHGAKFPLMLNATNREFIIKTLGDTDKWATALIGKLVTLERKIHPAFRKEYVGIVAIANPQAPKPTNGESVNKATGEITEETNGLSEREANLKQLRALRKQETELLTKRGVTQTPITKEEIDAMSDETMLELIKRTESNVLDLRSALQTA